MNYSSRFWLYAPITLFLAIAAGVMVHWWFAADAFEKKLAALKGREAVPGITIDWSGVEVGGFPFRIDAAFTGFSAQGAGAHGPFSWKTEKFALHTLTYGRAKQVYEAAGRQQVRWTDPAGRVQGGDFLPGSLHASSILDGGRLARFDLDIIDLAGKAFAIGRAQLHMRRDPDGKDVDVMLRADFFKGGGLSFKQVQVYSTLSNAAALTPLLRGEARWPDAIAAWRAQGGTARPSQVVAPGLSPDGLLSMVY